MALPKKYEWLSKEGAPRMLVEALKEYGTLEAPGNANNPKIIKWAKEVGGSVADVFTNDLIPWCGLFIAVIAKRAGYTPTKEPLWALNWNLFGQRVKQPMLGDVLVFVRKTATGSTAGHVAIYVGEDATTYHCLGGNQSDSVSITRIAKNRLYGARRPIFKVGQPANVRVINLESTGTLSQNEA